MDIDSTMNALIAQFAEQAKNSVPAGLDTVAWIEKYNEIFAELIVRECVLISRTSTDGFKAGQRMEEHFGVE